MAGSKKRLLLSVACGLLCALLLALYVSDLQAQLASQRDAALARYGGETVQVFTAAHDIAAGEILGEGNMVAQTWLADLLPAGAVIDKEEALGKAVAVPLLKNEPIALAKLGSAAQPVTVPQGLCAVSVPSADVQAVGGAIGAGSLVNVYASNGANVALLGSDVLVLATSAGSQLDGAAAQPGLFSSSANKASLSWVTLAVEPHKVQELIAASQSKSLHLVLPGESVDAGQLAASDGEQPAAPKANANEQAAEDEEAADER